MVHDHGSGRAPFDRFLDDVRALLGPEGLLLSSERQPAELTTYTEDWTHRWSGSTPAVLRPRTTDQVAAIVSAARRHHVPLVPQGGNTGLVGGAVPHHHEVVVSLRRMDQLDPVDTLAAQVTAGAGVTLEQVQRQAVQAGLAFGVDLAARGSATVGGMVATNAGGTHVVRYGSFRRQLVGVEAVLGTGEVVSRMSGLVKDNTGYDLAQLLCSSEGTLGIVTRARLALVAAPKGVAVALVALDSVERSVALAADLRQHLPGIRALELMTGPCLGRAAEYLGRRPPVPGDAPAYLLVEVDGDGEAEGLIGVVSDRAEGILATVLATSARARADLWEWREVQSEVAVARARERGTLVHKLDVTLPVSGLADFCAVVGERLGARCPGVELFLFGHVGDGNVHVNVVPAGPADGGLEAPEAIDDGTDGPIDTVVLELVVERGGSISAEHGIGVAKRAWLERDRSPVEVAAMRAVKAALDPDGILNPGVLL